MSEISSANPSGDWRRYFLGTFIVIVLLFGGTGCATGRSALERGDYLSAVVQAVGRLKSNPQHEEATFVLRDAYPLAIRHEQQEIARHRTANRPFRWESVLVRYDNLNRLAATVSSSPAALAVVGEPRFYHAERNEAEASAVAERMAAGDRLLASGLRQQAREAIPHYRRVLNMLPKHVDAQRKLAKARALAITSVVVKDIAGEFAPNITEINEQIAQRLTDTRIPFTSYHRLGEIEAPDHVAEIILHPVELGEPVVKKKRKQYQRDDVVIGQTRSDPPQEVVGTVKATVTHYQRTIEGTYTLTVKIINLNDSATLLEEVVEGALSYSTEWARFQGDERALPEEVLALTRLGRGPRPKPEELLVAECDDISTRIAALVSDFYRRY